MRRLALIDLDNTLIDRASVFRQWATRFCQERALPTGSVERLIISDSDGHRPREDFFADVRAEFALPDTVDELTNAYRLDYLSGYVPNRALLDALGRLRSAGWKIVIVTNGPATYQREKIALSGLSGSIDGSCISEVIGTAKPSLAIFEAAAALVGCPLEGWMVGDSAEHDIGGGQAAGLDTIWLSRGRRWEQSEFSPSHICDSVIDAVELILAVG